jgi:hypothetical protein
MNFTHMKYGKGVWMKNQYTIRYNKKPWVPQWLWKLVATADMKDMILVHMIEAEKNYQELYERALGSGTRTGN